jgi:hypothetical protein
MVSSFGFSIYVRLNNSYSVTYGSIGAVIVLMLWLYLLGLSITLGAEVNSEIAPASDAVAPRTPETKERKAPIVDAPALAPLFEITSGDAPARRRPSAPSAPRNRPSPRCSSPGSRTTTCAFGVRRSRRSNESAHRPCPSSSARRQARISSFAASHRRRSHGSKTLRSSERDDAEVRSLCGSADLGVFA